MLGEALAWHGGLTLDYLHRDWIPKYIECNPRTVEPGNATASGVNLPQLQIRLTMHGELSSEPVVGRARVRTHGTLALVLGTARAPNIEVRGPDGETISTATRTHVTGRTLAVLRQDAGKVTWVGVDHGKPGRYTITLLPGSPRISGIAATRPGSREIKATLTGSGRRRTLHYVIGSPAGERVAFFEHAGSTFRRLGTARGSRGAIHFTSAPGRGGVREIVAQIQVDGVPAPDRIVGHYRAIATVKTGKPRSLVVKRRGSALLISWRPVAGATRYAVVVKRRSAAERVVRLSARRHRIRLTGIAKTQSGTVAVSARGALLDWARPSVRRFRATRPLPTVLRQFKLLGKRSPKRRKQASQTASSTTLRLFDRVGLTRTGRTTAARARGR